MSQRNLKRLGLPDKVLERLKRQNLSTCQDILSSSQLELLKLGISDKKRRDLVNFVSKACVPKCQTAYNILNTRKTGEKCGFLCLHMDRLDAILHGGLPVGTLTEIAGPPGVGKTQFCLMLCVLATLPISMGGLDGQVIYIDTESAFSAKRLLEIAKHKVPEVYSSEQLLLKLLQRVFVHQAATSYTLKQILQKLEQEIISRRVKLIILDSVASLVRKEFGTSDSQSRIERVNLLLEQAAFLKHLAESFEIVIVVTNQVTTRLDTKYEVEQCGDSSFTGSVECVTAALGTSWAHCVTSRLIAQFLDSSRRQLMIAKSPISPCVTFTYTIQAEGIVLEGDCVQCPSMEPTSQSMRTRTHVPFASNQNFDMT